MEVVHFPSPSNSMDGHLTAAYLSCPTSPSGVSFVGSPQFFSAPSSPTRGLTADPFPFEAAAAEKAKGGATESDDFEFEIGFELSQRFDGGSVQKNHEDRPPQPEGDEPPPANMAFADELFSNGLVLPLKLPPRLQSPTYGTSHLRSSSSLAIRGGSSASGFSFKKEDFDPFEAALEKIRKEEAEWSPQPQVAHRRARSLSPRSHSYQYWAEQPGKEAPHQVQDLDPLPSIVEPLTGSALPEPDEAPESEKPAERPVESEPEKPAKGIPTRSKSEKVSKRGKERRPSWPIRSSSERPATATNTPESAAQQMEKVTVKKASFFRKGSKRQMIKDFLFRSASEGRVDSKDKLRAHTAAIQGSPGPKDLSFGSAHGVLYKSSDEAKKKKNTTMAYKPSALFECLRMKDQKKKKKN
ncbi:hypothetical protein H6P81_007782 [Aristolochia fimbriata]|uniref:Uncharacterized protein n=1 Tax=Aristolochia fimbriata TaxID=158543 RepID=A0AAV7F5Q5_ARIFI|nr:hypothetical protein H6P81_007782 [Aristolochia fimbriata]